MRLLHPSFQNGPLLEGKNAVVTAMLVSGTWAVVLLVGTVAWGPAITFAWIHITQVAPYFQVLPIPGEREWRLVEVLEVALIGSACNKSLVASSFEFYQYAGRRIVALNHWYPSLRRMLVFTQICLAGIATIIGLLLYLVMELLLLHDWFRTFFGSRALIGAIPAGIACFFGYTRGVVRDRKNWPSGKSPKIVELTPVPQEAASFDLVLAHLSDLHMTGGEEAIERRTVMTGEVLRSVIEKHERTLTSADLILITGDLTDAGRPSEWQEFFSLIPAALLGKSIILPGNHDVAIVSKSKWRMEDADARSRTQRYIRMISAMNLVQGSRAFVTDGRKQPCLLQNFLQPYISRMNDFTGGAPDSVHLRRWRWNRPVQNMYADLDSPVVETMVHALWRLIFPMAVLSPDRKSVVYVFDSTDFALTILGNAYGRAAKGDPEFMTRKLDRLRAQFKDCASLYAMHHHLLPPPIFKRAGWRHTYELLKSSAMVLTDAEETYEAIQKNGRSVVFHGHHHVNYMREYGELLQVIGAPSTTLGDELNRTLGAGFYVYGISRTKKRGAGTRLAFAKFLQA